MLMQLVLIISAITTTLLASEPQFLKTGPSGWQQFKAHGRTGLEVVHHNKSRTNDFEGSYSGKSVKGKVAGKKLDASAHGNDVDAKMNGDKATGSKKGPNYDVARGGRRAKAETDGGTKVQKATAGKYEVDAEYNRGSKSAISHNKKGRGTWASNLKGSTGYAQDKDTGKRGKIRGLRRNTKKVQAESKGKKVLAGQKKGQRSKLTYARVPNKRGRGNSQWTAQEQDNGREARTRIVHGRNRPVYQSSVSKKNSASVRSPKKGRKLATIKVEKYKDVPCQRFPDRINAFAEGNPDYHYYNKSLTVDMPKKNGGYEWPSCMDVTAKFKIPPGIAMDDLAGSLTVLIPNCGHFTCGSKHKCLGLECFYKDLCGRKRGRPSATHKSPAGWLLSETTANACTEPINSNRIIDIVFHLCPDPNSKYKGKACVKDTLSTLTLSSMEIQVDLYTVKKRPMKCDTGPASLRNVVKRACKRVELEYSVKWLNLPDVGKLFKPISKITRDTNCAFGKEMCLGTTGGGVGNIGKDLTSLFGGGRRRSNNHGGDRNGGRGRGNNPFGGLFGQNNNNNNDNYDNNNGQHGRGRDPFGGLFGRK
jgi:hypothetical protein